MSFDQRQYLFARRCRAFQLRVFCHLQHRFELRAWAITGSDQIVASHVWSGASWSGFVAFVLSTGEIVEA